MKFKRWAAGIAALLLILSMGLISCAKPAGGTPEDNPVPQEEEEEEERRREERRMWNED